MRRYGCWIPDVWGDQGFQNHGIYAGAGGGNNEQDSITAFNVITGIRQGSGDSIPLWPRRRWQLLHRDHRAPQLGAGRRQARLQRIVVVPVGEHIQQCVYRLGNKAIAFVTNDINAVDGAKVTNNTIVGWAQMSGSNGYAAIDCEDPIDGNVLAQNNVIYQRAGVTNTDFNYIGENIVPDTNCYFDASGNKVTKPSADIHGFYSDPGFTDITNLDFSPRSGSVLIDAGLTPPGQGSIAWDFRFLPRPQGTNPKIALGAYERVAG